MTMLKRPRPTGDEPVSPEELAQELRRRRELADARRADELERARAEAGHGRARAEVNAKSRLAELARAEREADVRAEAELARMYREFRAAGERTRIRSLMARSGEARALRLEWLRTRNLRVLVPVLIGFGVWSTTGVQQGAARLMGVAPDSPVWWTLWGLEALLIGAVCWIIVCRARLAASGGRLSRQAEKVGFGCLATSIVLNLVAAVPAGDASHVSGWAIASSMFAHALGPVGAAVTAHMIGAIDQSIAEADPWHDRDGQAVPRLTDLKLREPGTADSIDASESASGSVGDAGQERARKGVAADSAAVPPVPGGQRQMLPVNARPEAGQGSGLDGEAGTRTGGDRPGERESAAPRKQRPNKGVRVPESAKPAPRPLADEQHCERLVAAIDRGEVPEDASIRQVQGALGVGFGRAKRIKELYGQRLADLERAVVESLPERDEPPPASARAGLSVVGGER
ncbi:hypothetical protein E1281_11695 [Actinomadura sp. KC345]|uniref:hypothetical protein n=1 Tax=Actinomadura sp. KC345 TaxID=2530371 RepID=UPI0010435FDF|nr:hypothetical protein [Actinomadura sp. KC345]TDC55590.1 hypothetical protein E1281_11695 [Actinomadura sp. KC345]